MLSLAFALLAAASANHPRDTACFALKELDGPLLVRPGGDSCAARWTPASTFKIAHALIALDTGARMSVDEKEKWDGKDRGVAAWNRDLTLAEAVEHSAPWYFQRTARKIGHAREAEALRRLKYGNEDAGAERDLTTFWLEKPLAISADEQLDFLERFVRRSLPIKPGAAESVDAMLLQTPGTIARAVPIDVGATWDPKTTRLFSKTGSSDSKDGLRVRWLVGHLEKNGRRYVFASLVTATHELTIEAVTQAMRGLVDAGLLDAKLQAPNPEKPLRIVDRSETSPDPSFDLDAAIAWKVPAQVSFALDGAPVVAGDRVTLIGWLRNDSDQPKLIVVFPAGPDGFVLEPAPGAAERIPQPGPPMPPPVPPPPLALTLPAQSQLRLETSLQLSAWKWTAGKPRELAWTLLFWNGPKPGGKLVLP